MGRASKAHRHYFGNLGADILLSKISKCDFFLIEILYLEHIISSKGVQVDQQKIQAILDWPPPLILHS